MVQLLLNRCIPILLYGLEVCALNKSSLQSLDFTVNRFFTKLFQLFRTSDILIVHECQSLFGVEQPSVTLSKRLDKFVQKYAKNI